jgi:hypothetical protein
MTYYKIDLKIIPYIIVTMSSIVSSSEFIPAQHMLYTKPKANTVGGKSVGILNTASKKSIHIQTPLMMTWGANVYENPNGKSYDICLQFPRDEFSNKGTQEFLQMLKQFEEKVKTDAQTYARDWFGKPSMSREVIDALWSPMLKYPKNQTTMEPDTTRSPTLKLKLPAWQGEFKFELFDTQNNTLIPNEDGRTPDQLIPKGCEIACIIQCGGIWFANGKFGVTWKLFQGAVKPTQTLAKGTCHIKLDSSETVKVDDSHTDPNYDSDSETNVVVAQSQPVEQSDPDLSQSQSQGQGVGADSEEPETKPVKKVVKKKEKL